MLEENNKNMKKGTKDGTQLCFFLNPKHTSQRGRRKFGSNVPKVPKHDYIFYEETIQES